MIRWWKSQTSRQTQFGLHLKQEEGEKKVRVCISPSYKQIESRCWHGKSNIRGMFSAKQNPEDLSLYYASLIQRERYKEIICMTAGERQPWTTAKMADSAAVLGTALGNERSPHSLGTKAVHFSPCFPLSVWCLAFTASSAPLRGQPHKCQGELKLDSLHIPTMQHDKWSFSSLEDSVYPSLETVSFFSPANWYTPQVLWFFLSLIPHAIQIFWYYIYPTFSIPPSPWMYFTLPPSTKHHQSFSNKYFLLCHRILSTCIKLHAPVMASPTCQRDYIGNELQSRNRGHICDPDVEAGRYRFLVQILRNSGQENLRPGQGGTHL